MLKVLKPSLILNYGRPIKQAFDDYKTRIVQFDSYSQILKGRLG
jgi:hypothetical protein